MEFGALTPFGAAGKSLVFGQNCEIDAEMEDHMKPIALIWLLMTVSSPVLAKEATHQRPDPGCFYGNLSFSPGAEVAIGNLRYVCNSEEGHGVWARSLNTKLIPHCLYEGDLHGLGAVLGRGEEKVSCKPNGMWE